MAIFQCPACGSPLDADAPTCAVCGRSYRTGDGILDFVGGQFGTQLDPDQYDEYHGTDDSHSETEFQLVKRLAGDRWPGSLGAVVEIGCGTGGFSRAMIAHRAATQAVLTDVSAAMLRICRRHLVRLGIAELMPLHFATYSAHEACFPDAAFDTCVGASVAHHIGDVRGFLADVWRFLRPGGRAFFIEPSLRYHIVMGLAFADILSLLLARDPHCDADRQALLNWIAETRRVLMLQGDLAMLDGCEDKHMFIGETFAAMAHDVGFASAEALPANPDRRGLSSVAGLLARLGLAQAARDQILRLWPSHANRYLRLLHPQDLSNGYLFWLTKPIRQRRPPVLVPQTMPEPEPTTEAAVSGDGMPLRWALSLRADEYSTGVRLQVEGWFLANTDIKAIRLTMNGVARQAPVWRPRVDVHLALNREGRYAAWNSLCCGADMVLLFDGLQPEGEAITLNADLIFHDGGFVSIAAEEKLRLETPFSSSRLG